MLCASHAAEALGKGGMPGQEIVTGGFELDGSAATSSGGGRLLSGDGVGDDLSTDGTLLGRALRGQPTDTSAITPGSPRTLAVSTKRVNRDRLNAEGAALIAPGFSLPPLNNATKVVSLATNCTDSDTMIFQYSGYADNPYSDVPVRFELEEPEPKENGTRCCFPSSTHVGRVELRQCGVEVAVTYKGSDYNSAEGLTFTLGLGHVPLKKTTSGRL